MSPAIKPVLDLEREFPSLDGGLVTSIQEDADTVPVCDIVAVVATSLSSYDVYL